MFEGIDWGRRFVPVAPMRRLLKDTRKNESNECVSPWLARHAAASPMIGMAMSEQDVDTLIRMAAYGRPDRI